MKPTTTSSAQNQAQLRKERREAKIRAGGKNRLDSITSLAGGRPSESLLPVTPAASRPAAAADGVPAPATTAHADPEEVDISQRQQYAAAKAPAYQRQNLPAPDDLNPFSTGAAFPTLPGDADPSPTLLLQQLLGAEPTDSTTGLPPSLAALLNQPTPPPPAGVPIWRIVHAVFALVFGLSLALALPASPRSTAAAEEEPPRAPVFWLFATAELVLQSTRFFVERGRVSGGEGGGGWLLAAAAFLPLPYRTWVLLGARYAVIYTTLAADVLVVVFVCGVAAWWKSGGG